jgi:hypothetical protein
MGIRELVSAISANGWDESSSGSRAPDALEALGAQQHAEQQDG